MGPLSDIPAHPEDPVALIRPMKSVDAVSARAMPNVYAPSVTCWKVIPVAVSVNGMDDWPYTPPRIPSPKLSFCSRPLHDMIDGIVGNFLNKG